jgi:hypothetical protein
MDYETRKTNILMQLWIFLAIGVALFMGAVTSNWYAAVLVFIIMWIFGTAVKVAISVLWWVAKKLS